MSCNTVFSEHLKTNLQKQTLKNAIEKSQNSPFTYSNYIKFTTGWNLVIQTL